MCQVSVTCTCRDDRGAGWPIGAVIVGAAGGLVVVAGLVGLVASLIPAIAAAVGIVVAGWVVRGVAVAAIDEIGLRRHNRRMAAIYPHVARELGLPAPSSTPALPPGRPAAAALRQVVDVEVLDVRRPR